MAVKVTLSRGIGRGLHKGAQDKDYTYQKYTGNESKQILAGSPLPPVTLHLILTNHGSDSVTVSMIDFESDMGNFAVEPDTLTLAPGQTGEPTPMVSDLGVSSDTITFKVTLKYGATRESRSFPVGLVGPRPPRLSESRLRQPAAEHPDPAVLARELQGDDGPLPLAALDADLAAVEAHDPLDDHEAEAVAARLRRVVGLEEPDQVLLADPRAAVAEEEVDRVVVGARLDQEAPAGLHRLHRVLRDVEEHLLQLVAVGHDGRQRGGGLRLDRDAPVRELPLLELEHLGEHLRQVGFGEVRRAGPYGLQEVGDDPVEARHLLAADVDGFLRSTSPPATCRASSASARSAAGGS